MIFISINSLLDWSNGVCCGESSWFFDLLNLNYC